MGPVGRLVENAARGMLPTLSFATFRSAAPKVRHASFNCCGGAGASGKFASARRFAASERVVTERQLLGQEIFKTPSNPHAIRPF